MQLLHVGAAVLNQTPLAWESNKLHIRQTIEAARRERVSLLCLPELCITGYGCEDAFLSPSVQRTAGELLAEILPDTRGIVVSLGLPLPVASITDALYNTACLVADGEILGFVAKRFLAGDGIHYEPRWFKPWPIGRRAEVQFTGRDFPLGDIYFDLGGIKIGFEICEDAWVANRPGGELARRGVDVIFNPSASHFAFAKSEIRHRFVLEGSRAFGVSYLYSNLVGNEAGRAIYDGGALIASAGQLVAAGPRFSFADFQLTTALVDIDATRMARARSGSFQHEIPAEMDDCIRAPFDYPRHEPQAAAVRQVAWETGPNVKEEEFTRAISLALFDYLRKSRSRGFVVSLSGGADSAAVSCLVAALVRLGVGELGWEAFRAKLDYISAAVAAADANQLIRSLLTCVYQSTRNSSQTTRDAARQIAQAIGAEFLEFDVDALVQSYIAIVSQAIGRPLDWETDDLALQNIPGFSASARPAFGCWRICKWHAAV